MTMNVTTDMAMNVNGQDMNARSITRGCLTGEQFLGEGKRHLTLGCRPQTSDLSLQPSALRHLLLLLLLVLGSVGNRVWAQVTYHVINLSGNQSITGTSNSGTVGLPDAIKSPLVTSFLYYTDASCTASISEGASVGANTDIYVKYTYTNNPSVLDLSGSRDYNIALGATPKYLSRWDISGNVRTVKHGERGTGEQSEMNKIWNGSSANRYYNLFGTRNLWNLRGSDPYNIQIFNKDQSACYFSLTTGNTDGKANLLNSGASLTGDDAPLFTSFILVKSSAWTAENPVYEFLAATGNDTYYYTDGSDGVYPKIKTDATAANRQVRIEEYYYTFHIVRADGTIAISRMVQNPSSDLWTALPNEIKTPLIVDNSSNYKFFNSSSDAATYTSNQTGAGITTLSQVTGRDIYVGYHYDPTYAPSGAPKINNATFYNIKNAANNYFYSDGSHFRCQSTLNSGSNFQWIFSGDPYNMTITSGNSYVVKHVSQQGTSQAVDVVSTLGEATPFMVLNSGVSGYYNLARRSATNATSNEYNGTGIGDMEYLLFHGNQNNTVMQVNNDYNYYRSDRGDTYLFTFIETASRKVTIHILSGIGGTEMEQYSVSLATGDVCTDPTPAPKKRPNCTFPTFYSAPACTSPLAGNVLPADILDVYAPYSFDAAGLKSAKHIEFSSSFENAKWLNIKMPSRSPRWLYTKDSEKKLTNKDDDLSDSDIRTQYAFIGDPYHFRIVSRNLGDGYELRRDGGTNVRNISFKENSVGGDCWTMLVPVSSNTEYFRVKLNGTSDDTNEHRFWDSTGPVTLYNSNDTKNDVYGQTIIQFTYHVTTPLSGTDLTSAYTTTDASTLTTTYASLPAALKRKFVTKYKLYYLNGASKVYLSQAEAQQAVGTSSTTLKSLYDIDVQDIYVEYEYTLPFTAATNYADALANKKWYNLRVDSRWVYDEKPSYNSFNSDNSTPSDANRISDKYLFAFVGDPYEIRLICKNSGGDYYIGVPAGTTTETNATYSNAINSGISTWELTLPESSLGNDSYFCLHEFGAMGTSNYLQMRFSGSVLEYKPNSWHNGTCKVFVETPPVSHMLTYQVINASTGAILGSTASLYPEKGTAIIAMPEQLRRAFCTYTLYTSYTAGVFSGIAESSYTMTADKTIYVKCEIEDGIFTAESDLGTPANIKWKHVKGSYSNPYLTTNDGSTLTQAASVPSDVVDVDAYTFALVGNPYDFRLVSKKAGDYTTKDVRPASSDNNSTLSVTTTDAALSHWEAVPARNTGTFAFALNDTWKYAATPTGSFLRANNSTRQLAVGNQDNNYDFTLETYQPRINVTYKVFRDEDTQVAEATVLQLIGNAPLLPESAQRHGIASYTYHRSSYSGETITALLETDVVVYVTYTVGTTPFQFSNSYEDAHWYNMRFANGLAASGDQWIGHFITNEGNEGQQWWNNGGDTKLATGDYASDGHKNPRGYYAFIGDPYNFTIVNMYAGSNRSVTNGSQYIQMLPNGENPIWTLAKPYDSSNGSLFRIIVASRWGTSTARFWQGINLTSSMSNARIELGNSESANHNLLVQAVTQDYIPVSYRVYDKDKNFIASHSLYYTDNTAMTVSLPDILRRGYCDYTYYTDAAMTASVAEATAFNTHDKASHTYYVKYTLTEKGQQVFSSNLAEAADKQFHLKSYPYNSSDIKFVTSTDAGALSLSDAFTGNNAVWSFIGTPYGFKAYSWKSGKYFKSASGNHSAVISATANAGDDYTNWEAYLPNLTSRDEATLILKDTWKNTASTVFPYPSYYYASQQQLKIEPRRDYFGIITEPRQTYTFHIVDNSGRIAIKSTEQMYPSTPLGYTTIPSTIRSPYIADETLTFYTTATQQTDGITPVVAADGRAVYDLSTSVTLTPGGGGNIYVRYTNTALASKPLHLRGVRAFDMDVNGSHPYADVSGDLADINTATLDNRHHLWYFKGEDPYAVEVENVATETFLLHDKSGTPSLSLGTATANRYFIVMKNGGNEDAPVIELMAATGDDLGGDTPSDYYSVGRNTGATTLFGSSTYEHNASQITIRLTLGHVAVVYDIVDKLGKIVVAGIPNTSAVEPSLPSEWRSPMVKTYHYWNSSNFDIDDSGDIPTYTLKTSQTEIGGISEAADGHIYVTYDVKTSSDEGYVDMNVGVDYTHRESRSATDATQVRQSDQWGTMYRLQFTSSAAYHLENGSDREDTNETASGTHLYPYTNGDGPLYIYQESRWEAQKDAAASTRTRWTWYLLSPNNDPYRMMVTSWQNSHAYSGTNYYNFLRTYYNYDSDVNGVVTGNVTDDPRTLEGGQPIQPTEYMLLSGNGTTGDYRLVTSEEIGTDGSGYESTNHRVVNSFEQYWRNNPTVQRKLGLADASGEPTAAQKATLKPTWHDYNAYVNAAPWEGGSKSYARGEHWFMTVEMGDGSFNLVGTEMNAVLILVDNHGWEVMRHNIYKSASQADLYAASLPELKKYDSPMVARYRYYTNATKHPGYHKYTVSESNLQTTTTSLGAAYPQSYQGGMLRDLVVTYDVKPDYADAYSYDGTTQSPTAYLIKQGDKYAKAPDSGTAIAKETVSDLTSVTDNNLFWYVQRNVDIDEEMAYVYNDPVEETLSKAETEAEYQTAGKNGLDPYNLQIKNKATGQYFKSNLTGADLTNTWAGVYSETPGVSLGTDLDNVSGEGHDNTTLHITNATFMAVDDGNGNMRLMPRFDQSKVMTDFATLETQQAAASAEDDGTHSQTFLLKLANRYHYIIIDNEGREALHFTSIGDAAPMMKNKFQSPLATGFTFYKTATDNGSGSYTLTNPITTFANASLTDGKVYVRYEYNPAADIDGLLKGTWYTMKINGTQVHLSGGSITAGTTNGTWRFLHSAGDTPDPYAVELYNYSNMSAAATTDRYIVMNHNGTAHTYALMKAADTNLTDQATYRFLSGSSPAAVTQQADYATNGTMAATMKVTLEKTVVASNVHYRLISNSGKLVLQDSQTGVTATTALTLPEWMRTPVMTDDAYIFYPAADYDSGTGTYTVKGEATTTPVSLDADGYVYVRYDYDKSKTATSKNYLSTTATLDLSGHIPYFLANTSDASWLWYKNGDGINISQRKADDAKARRHEATMAWYLTGNDPYEFRIANSYDKENNDYGNTVKYVSVHAHTTDANNVSAVLRADNDATDPLNTFMVMRATGGNSSKMVILVSGNEHLTLQEYNSAIRVSYDATAYSARYKGNTQIRTLASNTETFSFYPSLVYHVITNQGKEALACAAPFSNSGTVYYETVVRLPRKYQTPLISQDDYVYHIDKPEWNSGTGKLTVTNKTVAANTALTKAWGDMVGDLYVRYTYDPETSPLQFLDGFDKTTKHGLDLSGKTWYTMATAQNSNNDDITNCYTRILRLVDNDNTVYFGNYTKHDDKYEFDNSSYNTYYSSLSDKRLLWRPEGNDPYAIKIRNAARGTDNYLSVPTISGTGTHAFNFTSDSEPEAAVSTFMYLNIHSTNDGTHYGATLIPTGRLSEERTLNNSSSERIELYKWNNFINRIGSDGTSGGDSRASWVYFYKAPATRKYHYHAYNQAKGEWTWDAVLENDFLTPVVLDDQIARLYAKYEANTVGTTLAVTGSNTFKTRAELEAANNAQFYSDEAMTQRVYDTNSSTYDIYPEINEDDVYDIYFKYQPDTEAEVSGRKLGDITSTAAQVQADVDYREANGKLDERHLKNDTHANWFFMVLDTDADITTTTSGSTRVKTGSQHFLRREDGGGIGCMHNSYTLHKETADNYNNWTYNRLAESYRQGENDAFREGRWLWTFVGDDPYTLRLLNMESAVGVTPEGEGVYKLTPADNCWTTVSEETTEVNNITTTTYPVSIPTAEPAGNDMWGLVGGYSGEATIGLLSTVMTKKVDNIDVNQLLYWQMQGDSVACTTRTTDRSQAIQVLPYEPVKYEDVKIVIRRKDEVEKFKKSEIDLDAMTTGISKLYFAAHDRKYVAGDRVDLNDEDNTLPFNIRRAFCEYTLYKSVSPFDEVGSAYTVVEGPYPDYTKPLKNGDDNVYDEDGHQIYKYFKVDPATGNLTDEEVTTGAQAIYAHYVVKSDIFLASAPTQTEVAAMANSNDHVYFMDFPDPTSNATHHHAYYDPDTKFFDRTGDLKRKIDSKLGRAKSEKKKWNGSEFVDDTDLWYNNYQYRSASNRMVSTPERLKWYFVGDPYKVQVYSVAGDWGSNHDTSSPQTVAANLARFDETETNFQFVVDCVHLRVPDYSIIDERKEVSRTDMYGNPLEDIPNRHYNQPYFDDFYWECVPAASSEEGTFALRFKEDNDLLGYRNVYYYLAHDGLQKGYITDGKTANYDVNLSYNPNNETHGSGDYPDYHKANDRNTIIRLVQPAKVYVSAFAGSVDESNRKTTDELSEYFGVGETLTEVPRHLQRKFVSYEWTNQTLTLANASNVPLADCSKSTHTTGTVRDLMPSESQVAKEKVNPVYKFNVNYTVSDLSKDESGNNVHLFTTDINSPQWVDMWVSPNNWLFYDKNQTDKTQVSSYRTAVQDNSADGWNDGLKGLHWALVGDPYNFTILNRRRYEANDEAGQWIALTKQTISDYAGTTPADSIVWTTSLVNATDDNTYSTAIADAATATHFSTQMWKLSPRNNDGTYQTGNADGHYFLRTASLKTTTDDYNNASPSPYINQTNNYWRMVCKPYPNGNTTKTSYFEMVPYSLAEKSDYNGTQYGELFSSTMSGLGVVQQRMEIRTAVAKDEDDANNNCFDADVEIRTATGVLRLSQKNMEIRYGDAIKNLPISLQRFGCKYTRCYLNYDEATNSGTVITNFGELPGEDGYVDLSAAIETAKNDDKNVTITYIYELDDDVAPYFTTAQDAKTDDYTWMNTYFQWEQTYSGTSVEVERTRRKFDHYVYNSAGQITGEVWIEEPYIEIVNNPTEAYTTKGYLNTHTGQTPVYGDETTQSEDDRQKWSLVGDPYSFEMKNYAQYLTNPEATVALDGQNLVTQGYGAQQLAIAIGKDGKPFMAVINPDGTIKSLVDFEFASTSDKSLYSADNTGVNTKDATGNTLNTIYKRNGATMTVKPFYLANLIRYADILVYHLVMAHQYSLGTSGDNPYPDDWNNLTTEQQKNVNSHLLEFLMYRGLKDKNNKEYYISTWEGEDPVKTPTAHHATMNDDIRSLLKQRGTLRNFLSYPVVDQEVDRVGIGNRPQVPWYMKRQFCQYTMYQRDVLRSKPDPDNPVVVTIDGKDYNVWANDVEGKVDTLLVGETKPSPWYKACNITWESIFDKTHWTVWTDAGGTEGTDYETVDGVKRKIPSGYAEALGLQGQVLEKLLDCHHNRKVIIDVVYDVNPNEFQFAQKGRNTTAWYQMMTNNAADGLMNFTYKDGIGARLDRTHHYTNNYLWAPEGDPYGFVLRSRYATINGTGWDDVAVTTKGKLPKGEDASGNPIYKATDSEAGVAFTEPTDDEKLATYTSRASSSGGIPFSHKRIIHRRSGQDGAETDGATNAVYEMFVGGYDGSFLMHPTAAWMDNDDADHQSYYMKHFTTGNTTSLTKSSSKTLLADPDANWRLAVTAEQLIPYFNRSGYVGGLDPTKAQTFTNTDYYSQLQQSIANNTTLDFATLRKIQELVYSGTFYKSDGTTVVKPEDDRPTDTYLPMKFVAENLVNMKPGYYRIEAFSEEALNTDGNDLKGDGETTTDDVGVVGPRFISGYRFESEKEDPNDAKNNGGRWLHFFETDKDHSRIHTFADLKKKIDDAGTSATDRDWFDHKAMAGNIEILPADFDPSSIFQFVDDSGTESYTRYKIKTQGLTLWARPGTSETDASTGTHEFGRTELVETAPSAAEGYTSAESPGNWDNKFRLEDIGGAATTIRVRHTTADNWDDMVSENLKTNYVCIDRNHRYRITCHTDNEMVEIGDHYTTDGLNGIQDTKWLLKPVGIREQWPYNEMPLRVEVHQGGVKNQELAEPDLKDASNKDTYYYGSLYVPFDTRLANTTDAAFTLTSTPTAATTTVTMQSVSQLNNMGNPQYVPAEWPVIIRTGNAKSITLLNQNASGYATRYYVNMYLPNDAPVTDAALTANRATITLGGKYLEQSIAPEGKRVMVFGLPFENHTEAHSDNEVSHHEYNQYKHVGWYSNDNWNREDFSGYKAHAASYPSTADVATDAQRSNRYVYHNKVYLLTSQAAAVSPAPSRHIIALFDGEGPNDDEPYFGDVTDDVPWPCDVYDLQGRKVAANETPATLLYNHPGLAKGVYIFGGRKVIVK